MGEFGEVVHEMGWFYGKGTRSEGAKERRREEGEDWQAKCCAGGKGEGCGFEGERFLKMWNRMYIYIRPSQDKKPKKEEEKKAQRKRRI
jgi:hypothetical protein